MHHRRVAWTVATRLDLDLDMRNIEQLSRDHAAVLARVMEDDARSPGLGEDEEVRHQPSSLNATEDLLVGERDLFVAPQFEAPGPYGQQFGIVALDAGPEPSEAGRLHGLPKGAWCRERDLMTSARERGGDR